MKKRPVLFASLVLAACSGPTVAPPSGGGNVGRGELRQAPAVAAARLGASDLVTSVQAHLANQRATLSLTAADAFAPLRTHVSVDGADHVRLQQTHAGIKVWGADVVAHVDPDGQLLGVDGDVMSNLGGLDLNAAVADVEAMATAKRDYASGATAGSALAYSREANELVILPRDGGSARLAWHTSFFTDPQGGIKPGLWNYMIDAHDGSILQMWNGLDTAVVEASGPGGNTRVPRTWTMNLDVTQNGTTYTMDTTQYQTSNLNHATSGTGTIYSGTSLTNFNPNDPAANDAHGFAEQTIKMLKDWFNYNSIDNAGYKLPSRVHYSTNYANAFWDGTQMNYGDGDGKQLTEMSGSLDVVAHEIDHGFTSNHSNLTYSGMSGGMNESFSDIAGTAAKFYYNAKTASFDLGGDIFIQPNTYIRWMCKPSTDGSSIDSAAQYNSSLDVHFSSGVMNRAFCHAAKRLSGVDPTTDTDPVGGVTADGVKKAAYAFYVANANYWTANATFTQGCQGVVDAATKTLMYNAGDISALGDSWKDVGVTCTYTHVNDFTLSLTPATATAPAGGTATFMVKTGIATGSTAQALMLTATSKGGLTGTFAPASVMSGATSTVTVSIPASTMPGDVTFTVSAAGTGVTRTVDGTVTVTAPPPDMAMPPDMAQPATGNGEGGGTGNGTGGGNGTGTGGNGLAGNGSMSGCSVSPGSAAGSSATLFFALVGVALLVARRRRA